MRIGMCLAAVNGGEVHRKPGALRKTTGLFPSLPTPPPQLLFLLWMELKEEEKVQRRNKKGRREESSNLRVSL